MASMNSSTLSPPIFNGKNYHVWSVKIKAYLRGLGLWKWVETEKQVPPLGNNPTLNQIKAHDEEDTKAPRALGYIHAAVAESILTRIMACENPKEAWDKLKEMYMGSEKTKRIQILNLKREFEILRMTDNETIKEYADRLMEIVNKIRLHGKDLSDQRVVETVLMSLPERFEPKISSFEDSKDLSQISLSKLVHAFQAQEQRRSLRQEVVNQESFFAKQKGNTFPGEEKKEYSEKKDKKNEGQGSKNGSKKRFPPCSHCKRSGHSEISCWFRPNVQCKSCQQFGHVEKVSKKQEESTRATSSICRKSTTPTDGRIICCYRLCDKELF